MIQEYLLSDKTNRDELLAYNPSNIERETTDFEKSDCWIVTYAVQNNDEDAAKQLSDLNEHIMQHFHPTVLSNGCAEYFNKKLFPLINEFERKLRKLLYLKSALNKDKKASENIKDLEEKDLGKIFEILFTDESFTKEVRSKIKNEITWQFAKNEICNIISSIREDTLWDKLIGTMAVPSLRENYLKIRSSRNDIVHAHNINFSEFKEAKKLFQSINQQLDLEIGLVIATAEKRFEEQDTNDYNVTLGNALYKANLQEAFSQIIQQLNAIHMELEPTMSVLQSIPKPVIELSRFSNPALEEISNALKPIYDFSKQIKAYGLPTSLAFSKETLEAIQRMNDAYSNMLSANDAQKGQEGEADEQTSEEQTAEEHTPGGEE